MMECTPKQARLLCGLTQKEVANKLGIHVQTYSKLAKHPYMFTIEQAKILSNLFGLRYDLIFFDTDSN